MFEALLLGLIAVIGLCEYLLGSNMLERPIVLGPLVGLALGDLRQGIILGGMLELAVMGIMYIGGAVSVNVLVGGVVGTAIAIQTGTGIEVAATIAIPVGILYNLMEQGYYILIQYFVTRADEAALRGDYKAINKIHFTIFSIWASFTFLVVFVSTLIGPAAVQSIVDVIPDVIYRGIEAGTLLLPALGFGVLLNLIWNKKIAPFYFIGFVLAAYVGMDNLAIAILAISISFLFFLFSIDDGFDFYIDEHEVRSLKTVSNRAKRRVLLRSYTLEASFNYVKFQGLGYCYSMIPALEELFPEPEKMAAALQRHLVFFNTSPQFVTFVLGISVAMEEEHATNEEFSESSINALKTALMGPLAGVGDAFWWGIVRVVAAGIACELALKGSILGPIVFIVMFNVPQMLFRYYGLDISYKMGKNFLRKISESNLLQHLSLAASIAGLMVIGGMTVSMIGITTPLQISFANIEPIVVQEMLDMIMPGILPLISLFIITRLLKKNIKVTYIMIGLLGTGILGTILGVF